jgi:hypothetical protein
MTPFYTLWDVEVGNSLGTYPSEAEVRSVVEQLLVANGPDYADVLEVGLQDTMGEWRRIAIGDQLSEWVSNHVTADSGQESVRG